SIPLVLAVVGNWVAPAYAWRDLVAPVLLVSVGLVLVNVLEIAGKHSYSASPAGVKAAGLAAAFGGVAAWTWYALANARFLARHDGLSPRDWSTVVGVATGGVSVLVLPVAVPLKLFAASTDHASLARFLVAAVVLDVVVS